MTEPSFEMLSSTLFWSAAILSAGVLFVLRIVDGRGSLVEQRREAFWIKGRRFLTQPVGVRLRFGSRPALDFGRPGSARFINPTFALGEILRREPVSLLGPTLAWLAVLFNEPVWAVGLATATLVWRLDYDADGLTWMKPSLRRRTLLLKVAFIAASGVWYATVIYAGLLLLMAILVLLGFAGAQATKSRRR